MVWNHKYKNKQILIGKPTSSKKVGWSFYSMILNEVLYESCERITFVPEKSLSLIFIVVATWIHIF